MIIWPWLVLILGGLVLEFAGLQSSKDRWPTLTDVIRRCVPKTLIAAGIAWLAVHFGVQK